MTPGPKHLLYGGFVGAALFGLVIFAVEIPNRHKSREIAKVPLSEAPADDEVQPPPSRLAVAPAPEAEAPDSSGKSIPPIAPLPPDATSIPDAYLLNLAAMVDLSQAGAHRPDKSRWRRAIPVAEKLMQGPCDCAQRNWLTRFIEMGNLALSNSDSEFYEHATLLASLGRNDDQAMAISRARN